MKTEQQHRYENEQMYQALKVLTETVHIAEYLALHDPKALEQAQAAVAVYEADDFDSCDECGVPYPEDARDSIGPWHADHCSRNSANTVP